MFRYAQLPVRSVRIISLIANGRHCSSIARNKYLHVCLLKILYKHNLSCQQTSTRIVRKSDAPTGQNILASRQLQSISPLSELRPHDRPQEASAFRADLHARSLEDISGIIFSMASQSTGSTVLATLYLRRCVLMNNTKGVPLSSR